jgi:hypothetical protein
MWSACQPCRRSRRSGMGRTRTQDWPDGVSNGAEGGPLLRSMPPGETVRPDPAGKTRQRSGRPYNDGSDISRVCFPGCRTPPIAGSGRYRAGSRRGGSARSRQLRVFVCWSADNRRRDYGRRRSAVMGRSGSGHPPRFCSRPITPITPRGSQSQSFRPGLTPAAYDWGPLRDDPGCRRRRPPPRTPIPGRIERRS